MARKTDTLVRFTVEDAEMVLGRMPTDEEVRRIVKSLPYSTMGEAFVDVVSACATPASPQVRS